MDHLRDLVKYLDFGAVAVAFGTLIDVMPKLAAVLTVLWLGARLYNEVMTAVYRRRRKAVVADLDDGP